MLEARTSRPVNPLRHNASSSTAVAVSLPATYPVTSPKSTPRPTLAAWWQTASTPATAADATAGSARSPTSSSALGSRSGGPAPSPWTDGSSESTTRTSAPPARRTSTTWEPMNPAPPVTRTFTGGAPSRPLQRQADGEAAAGALVVDADLAVVGLDQPPGHGQAEPAAAVARRAGGVAPVGHLEHRLQVPVGDTAAGVLHRHLGRLAAGRQPGGDDHHAAGRRVADGVVEQVAHHPDHLRCRQLDHR